MIRQSAVAGQFYEGHPEALRKEVEGHIDRAAEKSDACGCVCPHAGYIYSGDVAGAVLSRVHIPKTVVILSFSHRGLGERYGVWPEGAWATPLGKVPTDAALAQKLVEKSSLLKPDTACFNHEHSGEVMLPFLQVLRPDVQAVMVSIFPVALLAHLDTLGEEMAALAAEAERPLVLASSDMTHHEPVAAAERRDRLAIAEMLKLDEVGLFNVVHGNDISMCGVCPVVVAIRCVREMGATTAELVRYEHSGKVTRDTSSVVAYAGLIFR